MDHVDVTGSYEVAGVAFSIAERDGRLVMAQPEIPEGFEPTFERTGPSSLRIATGPWANTDIELEVENGRATRGLAGGIIPIERTSDPPTRQPGSGLLAPPYPTDPQRDSRFESAWKERPAVGLMSAPSEFPAYQFVQWLTAQQAFIFHGSNRIDIEEFRPVRESMELGNLGGHGNLGAVYGTHDGLWAMFFAVVDRSRVRGSIRNGVATYTSREADNIDLYHFSVGSQSLKERPFRSGALYVFPRNRFERIPLYPDGPPSNEWACFEEVRPIASLSIDPEDFPFLESVGAHNDDDLLRLGAVQEEVRTHVTGAVRVENGIRLEFDLHLDSAARDEWLELGRRFFPDVGRTVVDATTIELTGPAAFVHIIEEQFKDWLDGSARDSAAETERP